MNVGIGDWLVPGSGDPTERLDVLTGNVRIRDLANNLVPTRMVVADNSGVLWWQNIPTGGGGSPDCDWLVDVPNKDVTTAWDPAPLDPNCPAIDWNVGIGSYAPNGKLTVVREDLPGNAANYGVHVTTNGDAGSNYGVRASSTGPAGSVAAENFGVDAFAKNGTLTFGVNAVAQMDATLISATDLNGVKGEGFIAGEVDENIGVNGLGTLLNTGSVRGNYGTHGVAASTAGSSASFMVGAYGRSSGNGTSKFVYGVWGESDATYDYVSGARYGVYGEAAQAPNSYAGWFEGDLNYSGTLTNLSDATLKTNIAELSGASALLAQLQPKTYEFNTMQYPWFNLASGPQMGLLAQEVQDVLPQLVHSTIMPPQSDNEGNLLAEAMPALSLDYISIIPLLIAGFKEQQARIELQDQQIADLLQTMAACCVLGTDHRNQGDQGNGIGFIDNAADAIDVIPAVELNAEQLVVTPNPFTENPAITYRINSIGRAQLRVSSATGKALGVLFDANIEAGQHSMQWNTTGMATGMYLLSLTVDGVRVTEQAVKVE